MEVGAFVQFETKAVEDRAATIKAGHWVAKDVDFITITPPGGNLSVEREVDGEIKEIYGQQYEAWKSGQEVPVEGTHIKNWPIASPAQVAMCLRNNVRTIEELSTLPESGLQRIGMGANELKRKAQAWLEAANNTGKAAAEIERLTVLVEQLQKDRDELRGLLQQQTHATGEAEETKPKKRRGPRKKKADA